LTPARRLHLCDGTECCELSPSRPVPLGNVIHRAVEKRMTPELLTAPGTRWWHPPAWEGGGVGDLIWTRIQKSRSLAPPCPPQPTGAAKANGPTI